MPTTSRRKFLNSATAGAAVARISVSGGAGALRRSAWFADWLSDVSRPRQNRPGLSGHDQAAGRGGIPSH